jgi:hypothetical protein
MNECTWVGREFNFQQIKVFSFFFLARSFVNYFVSNIPKNKNKKVKYKMQDAALNYGKNKQTPKKNKK